MGCRVLNLIRNAKIWRRERVVRIGGEKEGEGSKGEMRVCCRKDGRWMKGRSGVEGVCMKA